MTRPIIQIDRLGKRFRIGARQRYYSLRESLARTFTLQSLRQALRRRGNLEEDNHIWALRDVSFEVQPGEVIGIIGRNGAGKSTLLKILSRITEPTEGQIEMTGRVGSLLEVGTGFHPELTGRENVFLNGAILGMTRREIKARFDEIVAFAEVEKFIDTAVKHYSSGMYMRLAFAIAAHLEPEILIVDEVLAVGDAAFQKKCLGKMGEVARHGRTVLFVSHNMAAVQALCGRAILLTQGRLTRGGATDDIVAEYLRSAWTPTPGDGQIDTRDRSGSGEVRLTHFWLEDRAGQRIQETASGQELVLVFRYRVQAPHAVQRVSFGFSLHTLLGETLCVQYSDYAGTTFSDLPAEGEARYRVPALPLNPGRYAVGARVVVNGQEADWPKAPVGQFDVVAGKHRCMRIAPHSGAGPVLIDGDWEAGGARVEQAEAAE
jgi:lipopolysaccharide transport system ATP-binding protein